MTDNTPPQPASPKALLFAACVMAGAGLFMVLQVFGIVPATWLNPNPKTPAAVFVLVGCFLLLGAGLAIGQVLALGKRSINAMGYTAVGLGWILSHWLVFLSEGGTCGIGVGAFSLGGFAFCKGVAAAVLLAFDALFLGLLLQALRRRL